MGGIDVVAPGWNVGEGGTSERRLGGGGKSGKVC